MKEKDLLKLVTKLTCASMIGKGSGYDEQRMFINWYNFLRSEAYLPQKEIAKPQDGN